MASNLTLRIKRSLRRHAALSSALDLVKSTQITLARTARRRKRVMVLRATNVVEFGESGLHTFFGYHDVTPFSRDGTQILANRLFLKPGPGSLMELGLYQLGDSSRGFVSFDTTSAWCWQMGARLQWWGSEEGLVCYNKTIDAGYRCVVYDTLNRKVVRVYDRALYGIAPDLRYGVALDFSRLERLRPGYGYTDLPDRTLAERAPPGNGLWLVDLQSGDSRLILTHADMLEVLPAGVRDADGQHYFNHILWSPDSSKFLFLHLIAAADGGRSGRAFIYDVGRGTCYPVELSGYVSHFAWRNASEILMYSRSDQTGVGLNLYNLVTGSVRAVARQSVRKDCHPMFSPANPNIVLLDSYPRRPLMERELYLVDIEKDERVDIAAFYSPPHLTGVQRCDLHPRWDRVGQRVAVDSGHAGVRKLVTLEIAR